MTYEEQLLDPRWKCKREQILQRDLRICQLCMSGQKLQVHHVYYIENRDAWDYPDAALITLCESCHEHQHYLYGNKYRKTEDRIPQLFRQIKESAYALKALDAQINGKEIH